MMLLVLWLFRKLTCRDSQRRQLSAPPSCWLALSFELASKNPANRRDSFRLVNNKQKLVGVYRTQRQRQKNGETREGAESCVVSVQYQRTFRSPGRRRRYVMERIEKKAKLTKQQMQARCVVCFLSAIVHEVVMSFRMSRRAKD